MSGREQKAAEVDRNFDHPVIPAYAKLRGVSKMAASGTLNKTNGSSENGVSEFLNYIESRQAATPFYKGLARRKTAAGGKVIYFSIIPAGVAVGMNVTDLSNLSAINGGISVVSIDSDSVTLSDRISGKGIESGDVIGFAYQYFKGPLFTAAMADDDMYGAIPKFSDGFVTYATIAPGITSGWASALVAEAENTSNGEGTLIGAEIDIGVNNSTNSVHCDEITPTVSGCHTNLWMSNTGKLNGSWIIDTGYGGAGWNNGISLRFISAGGTALDIPGQTRISSGSTTIAEVDKNNSLNFGKGAANIYVNAKLSGSSASMKNFSANADSGTDRVFSYESAGTPRWVARASRETESGKNSGSNFSIDRYNDSGSFLDSPLNINRASGLVSINNGLYVSGSLAVSGLGAIPLYSHSGKGVNSPHMVADSVNLKAGRAVVNLDGAAVFSAATSYTCTATDKVAPNPVSISQVSGSTIVLSGSGSDIVQYNCVGN